MTTVYGATMLPERQPNGLSLLFRAYRMSRPVSGRFAFVTEPDARIEQRVQ